MPDMLPLILDIIANGSVDAGLDEIKAAVVLRTKGLGPATKPTSTADAVRAVIVGHQPVLTTRVRKELNQEISEFFIDADRPVDNLGQRDCLCAASWASGVVYSPAEWADHFKTELEKVL